MNVITTNSLSKQNKKAMRVKDLDICVPQGSVYGFLGPNGAGKSTTMKMILGLTRPSSGSIKVFGKTLNEKNRISILKNTGSLIESPSYYGHLSGKENLKIISLLKNVPEKEIARVLEIVRLENQQDKKVSHYSLGMKQRLGLAGAMLGNPKLLLLDEPTNGLDPAGISEIRELICSLPSKYGITVMVSSHLLSEIDQMADHIGIISRGELVFQDSLSELHKHSSHKIAIRTMDNESAAKVMRERGVSIELQDGYILLPKISDQKLSSYITDMFAHEVKIVRIEERHKNLEDIFLDLTGSAVSL
jgi:ABC-type multidrug transport system ATPase subunit